MILKRNENKVVIDCKDYQKSKIQMREVKKLINNQIDSESQHSMLIITKESELQDLVIEECRKKKISIIKDDENLE